MTDTLERRNAEIFVRHCAGDRFSRLGADYGISRSRAEAIFKRAADRLAIGMPMTLPASSGAWTVVKRVFGERYVKAAVMGGEG